MRRIRSARPDYVATDSPLRADLGGSRTENPWGSAESFSGELLTESSKTRAVFDRLALKIDGGLDFPDPLVEKGFSGFVTLDLYLDHEGKVDEVRSRFSGDSRVARCLLSRAASKGLVEWFVSDAVSLSRDEFRNQHFQARFLSFVDRLEYLDQKGLSYGANTNPW